jgi:hypothetical protein
MSATRGTIETSSNTFNNTLSRDFILRTMNVDEKFVLGNTMCNVDNAALYITSNAIGIKKVPNTNFILDAPGFTIDLACNVTVSNISTTGTLTLGGNVIPETDVAYDLGASNKRFKDLYLSGNTVYIGETAISRTINGDVSFTDADSNLKRVICSELNLGGTTIAKNEDGKLFIGDTPIQALDYIVYKPQNNFTGFGIANPLGTLHAHNAQTTEMRLILSDQRTGVLSNMVGFQFWKDALSHGYIQNYFPGANINVFTNGTGNINMGNAASMIANTNGNASFNFASFNNAQANIITYTGSNNAGITLDASVTPLDTPGVLTGGRRFYIRTGASLATTTGGLTGNRAGTIEFGDGGASYIDTAARSNLMVLDKYSRLWIGRNIVPGRMNAGILGSNAATDAQPAVLIMGDESNTTYYSPVLHLGRSVSNNDLTGFSLQMVKDTTTSSNNFVLGRNDMGANSGYGSNQQDLMINYLGNMTLGGSNGLQNTTDKLRVVANNGATSNMIVSIYNTNSFMSLGVKSTAASFNPLVSQDDARIIFSSNNTLDSGSLTIGPWSSTRRGLRLTSNGPHEVAGDLFMNGRLGIANSNPTFNLDITGSLRVSSNASVSNITTCNLITPNITGIANVLNIGGDSNTTTINIACATTTQIVNIGSPGASNTTINIGGPGDTVNIAGTTNTVNATTTTSCNKTIDMNFGGAAGTGAGAGININEGGTATGYIRVSTDRNAWLFKAPNAPETRIDLTNGNITMGGLTMNTNSNVGIGNNNPTFKLDVTGAINATSYCNFQWSMIQNIPGLSGFNNDLSNFTTLNSSNLRSSNLTVGGTTALSNAIAVSLQTSNLSASNATLNTITTSTITTGSNGVLTVGCDSNNTRIDIGTNSNTSLMNIGTINNGAVINIGGSNDTIQIGGTLLATLSTYTPQPDDAFTYVDYYFGNDPAYRSDADTLVTTSLSIGQGISPLGQNTAISDKFRIGVFSDPNKVTIYNKDGAENSGGNAGFEIQENGVTAGWFETFSNRMGYSMKAPGADRSLEITMGTDFVNFQSNTITMIGASNGTVGIGTSSPSTSYKLHVAGSLYANSYVNLPQGDVFGTSGIVSLCNAVNSTSQISAATASAVKTAFDAAIAACNVAAGRWIQTNATSTVNGTVRLCDAINSNLDATASFAATPKSVMDTYNFAATRWSSNRATEAAQGIVFITDSTSCNVGITTNPIAASARAVFNANTLAASKWTAVFASNNSPGYVFVSDATDCNRSWTNTDVSINGPLVASVKAVRDVGVIAIAASNRAFNPLLATDFVTGSVTLSTSLISSNLNAGCNIAATPSAVSTVNTTAIWTSNFANTRWSNLNASSTVQGTVQLSDSVSSTSGQTSVPPIAATPAAVKIVNDRLVATSNVAYTAWQPVNASTTVRGYVFLTDATNCNSGTAGGVPVVPTALALSNVSALLATTSNRAFTTIATATDAVRGGVLLSDSVSSTSGIAGGLAATPLAVKTAWDLANGKFTDRAGTNTLRGTVFLTDATDCNVGQATQPIAASAKAVRDAMQAAIAASNWASARPNNIGAASLTAQGAVQLSEDLNSTSQSLAATIAVVKQVNDGVSGKLNTSGGALTGPLTSSSTISTTSTISATGFVSGSRISAINPNITSQFLSLSANNLSITGLYIPGDTPLPMQFGFATALGATTNAIARLSPTTDGFTCTTIVSASNSTGFVAMNKNTTSNLITYPSNGSLVIGPAANAVSTPNITRSNVVLRDQGSRTYVGINCPIPNYPLHLLGMSEGFQMTNTNVVLMDNISAARSTLNGSFTTIGVFTDRTILASSYIANSDRRIKQNIHVISDALDILKQLNCVKYNYIDTFDKGVGDNYGFIAQEVERVLPDAVTKTEGFVPLMQKVELNVQDNHSYFLMKETCDDLKIGTTLRMYDRKNNKYESTIMAVEGNRIVLEDKLDIEGAELLLYGYEVDDFRSIEKDDIFAITTKAVQELHEIVVEKEKRITKLETEVAELKELVMKLIKA